MFNWQRSKPLFVLLIFTLVFVLSACGDKNRSESGQNKTDSPKTASPAPAEPTQPAPTESDKTTDKNSAKNPVVTIEMSTGQKIKLELYPKVAPNTVNNFISLIHKNFYDGKIFHRVIPGFMIQGGDPNGNGSGGPGYSIKGEFTSNNFPNDLLHTRGVLSMARTNEPDSAGSQFFIMAADATSLDGQYAAFGKVVEGLEVVDSIVGQNRDSNDKPATDQVMKKVTVDTFGVTYKEPEIIKP
ncbi:peptidyl-prolyl cis-trans isomerase B (cyclophilin B) [Paenibacillus shirakamiensis]|uniref:Peptidyl-prolyl cis-trans isomerase n=1 Tax=Paenibacillus shirakamiensis TaxID=1265935 RepID=A0ABS4JG82_9BACL|nr:peptidylprolyl isomerase [Paenibacillus shirakamiensis]MBP2000724.1 peptidyl-prolyl cis-trans isomerase B (cyclophilin B) [Paenibacillus shirakamiensis]